MFFGSEWRNPEISSFSLFLILFLFHVFQNFHDLSVFYKNSLGKQSTSPIYDTNKVQNDEKVPNLVFVPSSLAIFELNCQKVNNTNVLVESICYYSTSNFEILAALLFQLEVTRLTYFYIYWSFCSTIGTIARWYSSKTPLPVRFWLKTSEAHRF